MSDAGLVQFRTPTYRRPADLARCLRSMQAQTWTNWVCDVQDDDPEGSARAVVEGIGDPRIAWHQNRPQRFASGNIDACFSRDNPRGADWFCVVEDDNLILPEFAAATIALAQAHGVRIVLRNQRVERDSGTPQARLDTAGVLDEAFREGVYPPGLFRLSMVAGIGVSNGGLFWSRHAATDLEIGFPVNATLQEYLRTYVISEPVYVAMEPLAVWAENGAGTNRNLGDRARYLRRELDLKRAVQLLRRRAWARADPAERARFLSGADFRHDAATRAEALVKAHLLWHAPDLPLRRTAGLLARGLLIRLAGRVPPALHDLAGA